MTPSQFTETIGRRLIADALGVGPTAVGNAVVAGAFPSSWFDVLEMIAEEHGLECPRSMFSFRASASTRNVEATSAHQEASR